MTEQLIQFAYLVATALFVFSLKWLSHPTTARRGVLAGVTAMGFAIGGTLLAPEIVSVGDTFWTVTTNESEVTPP